MKLTRYLIVFLAVAFCNRIARAEDAASVVAPGAKVQKIAGGMKFTEGPAWLPKQQKLIFSDIPNSKLMQWSESDGLSEYRTSKHSNGNILDLEGRLISCQHSGRNIVRTGEDGNITVVVDRVDGKQFNSPNDVAVRSDGSFYFTDPPWGLWGTGKESEVEGNFVYRKDPKTGKVTAIIKDLAMPNGIVFSPDEKQIYVADTGGHPRHPDPSMRTLPGAIHCYEVDADGNLGKKLFKFGGGSDGMAVDVHGNIYTTHKGKVHVFSGRGRHQESIDVPEGPANVCFGGKDFKTLFITARTSLYSVRLAVAGAKPKGASW